MASRRIFFGELSVTIIDAVKDNVLVTNQLYIDARGMEPDLDLWSIFDKVKAELCVLVTNVELACETFFSNYDKIDAAGGLVNSDGSLLWIFRNGRWDLPKGKVESGEAYNEAAVREISEECGLRNLSTNQLAGLTYHCYTMGDKKVLKTTHWFEMEGNSQDALSPQAEEGITKVEWIKNSDNGTQLANTYASIRSLITDQFDT